MWVGSDRVGLSPCHAPLTPNLGNCAVRPLASRCPSLGPSRVRPGARAPLGHPRRCLPRGDPISRAQAQLRAPPKPPGGCLRRPAHSASPFLYNFIQSSILCRPALQGLHPREALPEPPARTARRRSLPERQSDERSPERPGAGPAPRQHARPLVEREGGAAAAVTAWPGFPGAECASGFVLRGRH